MANPTGKCSICGVEGPLSFEHVPPKAAFNDRGLRFADLEEYLARPLEERDDRPMRMRKQRRGAGGHTLCERCNNETGAMYGPAYVDWAWQGMRFHRAGGSSLALPFLIFPGRVAKQIMCMFGSLASGLFDGQPTLRKFVMDRDARGLPDGMRIFAFLLDRASTRSRSTGITSAIDGLGSQGSRIYTFAELSFVPFGYILTVSDSPPPDPKLVDITFFSHHGYNDFRELHFPLPTRPIHSYFPADFRSREEWERVAANV